MWHLFQNSSFSAGQFHPNMTCGLQISIQNMRLVKWLGQAAQLAGQRTIWAIQTSYVFGYILAPEFVNHPILFKTMGPVAGYNSEDNSTDPMYLLISWAGISGQIWENWAGWVMECAWINSVPPCLLKSGWITTPSESQSPQSSCPPQPPKKNTHTKTE